MPDEPLPVKLSYAVIRGMDSGRVGIVVSTLEMEELFGGWREWFLERMRVRPRRRWQAVWIELEFPEGDRGAYRLSDLEARHG